MIMKGHGAEVIEKLLPPRFDFYSPASQTKSDPTLLGYWPVQLKAKLRFLPEPGAESRIYVIFQ